MENAWRIPVRTVLTLAGPWDKVSVTVSPWTPCPKPESPDAGEDPEPIDDLGLCCEARTGKKQYADEAWRIADQLIKDKE